MKQFLTLSILTAMMLTGCHTPKPAEADLVVLYTTDVHGAFLPFDIKKNAPAEVSLANVCTYVQQVRDSLPGQTLLLDTGDFLQGQPSCYYYNYVDTLSQHAVARAYNYLQYDAIGVGNHDIETGEAVYGERFGKDLSMPWLCANAIDTRTGQPMFQPYAVFERQGIKVAVLGLITPNIHAWLPKTLWPHLEFEDMTESARRWVAHIEETEHPDVLVGLFHAGSDYTVGGADMDTYKNENGSIPVAMNVPGFDLCLLGHDHKLTETRVCNIEGDCVVLLDAGTQARYVGRAGIHLTLQEDGTYRKEIVTSKVAMAGYAPDAAYSELMQPVIDTVNAYVDAPICELTADLPGIDGLFGPCRFMDLIHDAQLWATGADISLAAVLSPHDVVPQGTITMRHLFTLYKYENQLFTLQMKAQELKQYLEFGFDRQFNVMTSANDHLLAFKTSEKGQIEYDNFGPKLKGLTFNYTSAAGIRYEVDVTRPAGEKVRLISMSDGSPIDYDRLYTVALNSYQYSGGGEFVPKGLGWDNETLQARTVSTTPIDVRRYIAQYLEHKQVVEPHLRGDWQVVPTQWWQNGKARDIQLVQHQR